MASTSGKFIVKVGSQTYEVAADIAVLTPERNLILSVAIAPSNTKAVAGFAFGPGDIFYREDVAKEKGK